MSSLSNILPLHLPSRILLTVYPVTELAIGPCLLVLQSLNLCVEARRLASDNFRQPRQAHQAKRLGLGQQRLAIDLSRDQLEIYASVWKL